MNATQEEPARTVSTHTVGDGGDSITYDIHGDIARATPGRPALFMFGGPMDAAAFGALADQFTDRPVITYDPRGAGRNPTGTSDLTPETHADDIHRVIAAVGDGPVDVFATSGGAVNALAHAARYPDEVRRLVAHEPPLVAGLPDGDTILAAVRDIKATYRSDGDGPAMARFINLVMQQGPLPSDHPEQPAPDPVRFGMSADDDGTRTNPLIRNMPATNEHQIDTEALRQLGDRLIVAVGAESGEEIAARGGRAVAEQVGARVVEVPSHHAGFTADGPAPGDPEAFGAALRRLLD